MKGIDVSNLTKRFGDTTAVDDLSFDVAAGEIVGLLGANGAGKTTTMKIILGLLGATSGDVRMLGESVRDLDRKVMGYVPQGLGLYPELTVSENLEFVAAAFGVTAPDLSDSNLDRFTNVMIADLSLGVRRRVAFVAARCHRPRVLILDEPTSGVGPLGRARLWETIHHAADEGACVLVSTHYMDEAEECDRVVLLAHGQEVMSGTVSDLLDQVTAVRVSGDIPRQTLSDIGAAGGTALLDGDGWRVVGVDAGTLRRLVGRDVAEVPANFEEVFVSVAG